jgi:Flp pilus assembly protein TadG
VNRLRDQQGAGIIEFALGAMVLFMILFGVLLMCFAFYSYNVVSESAREATRYAIVRGSACTGLADCSITAAQIQSHVKNLGFPGINPSNLTTSTAWAAYPAGGACQPSASCNNPGNQVTVTVTYNFHLSIPFVPNRTLAMANSAAMVISQ